MSSCRLPTRPSSAVALCSWPVSGPNRLAEIAKDLRISESCLRNWLAQADVDEHGSTTALTSKEKKELVELRRDKRRLEMEVEILKRAAAYFARENVLPN